ncbi:MAG: hypothetical protein ACK41C_07165 [Phenylobacterium sp.]|jgi:hypothetical protein|uniref:hypothetical protein n=1 Tax=Phenylobacterium sp. TaxID=1871053 RepID=UPI00391AF8D2
MPDRLHYQARADQFARQASVAITEVERRGYIQLAERYRRMAEAAAPEVEARKPEPPRA